MKWVYVFIALILVVFVAGCAGTADSNGVDQDVDGVAEDIDDLELELDEFNESELDQIIVDIDNL